MKKNQNGFSGLEVLLVLVLVGIVGLTGWYVWHANSRNSKEISTSNNNLTPSNTNKQVRTKSEQKYLDIKEFGIKLPLSANITDAYYVISTASQTDDKPSTVWIGLKSLDSMGCAAAQANSGGAYPFGSIIKVKPEEVDPMSGTPFTQKDPDGVTIGGYYYAYISGISSTTGCVAKNNIKNVGARDAAFKTAGKKIIKD